VTSSSGFRDTYFVASNMSVAVVGDVQHDDIFAKLATSFADLRTRPPLIWAPVHSKMAVPRLSNAAFMKSPLKRDCPLIDEGAGAVNRDPDFLPPKSKAGTPAA